jgi:hypothetical protein
LPPDDTPFCPLGRDAEQRSSKGGKAYLRLNIAISERETTSWSCVTAFDPTAIDNADKFIKGARIYTEGRLGWPTTSRLVAHVVALPLGAHRPQ